jgi:1,4-dihydroxy-6-naphthoate synthase
LGHVLDKYVLLNAGSALGYGCGPLLVTGLGVNAHELSAASIAIPGRFTTAALLLRLYRPDCTRLVPMRFDAIVPSVAAGVVDAGVIIHESRFTYQQQGLHLVQDLGKWWEAETGLPIPLGGIAVKRSLGAGLIQAVDRAVAQSVRIALQRPEMSRSYIRDNAQEMDDTVIGQHIRLYVNSFSEDLGREGRQAIREFLRIGRESSVLPPFSDWIDLEFT